MVQFLLFIYVSEYGTACTCRYNIYMYVYDILHLLLMKLIFFLILGSPTELEEHVFILIKNYKLLNMYFLSGISWSDQVIKDPHHLYV